MGDYLAGLSLEGQRSFLAAKTAEIEKMISVLTSLGEGGGLWRDRWDRTGIKHPKINAIATDCSIRHNCGCCNDSPLEIWPYAIIDGIKISTDPECFTIGEKCFNGGDDPFSGWESKLEAAGIAPCIIEKAKTYFAENPPYIEEESSDGDQED